MIETLPAYVETAIYLYFAVIAVTGLFLQFHLWVAPRLQQRASA